MKIIFTGLPYFSKKLVAELKDFDNSNTYAFFDTYSSKLDQVKYLFNIINADIVVSFNGVTSKSKALDLAVFFKKKILMQWHGTDVLMALERKKNNTMLTKYIDKSMSCTDAPWLQEELKSANIYADLLRFKHIDLLTPNIEKFISSDVLSYVAEGKEEFYGIEYLLKLATSFPEVNFHIVGTKGKQFKAYKNIKFYGWIAQTEFEILRSKHPIFIRLTKHDGYALSILEALANGNEVLWNYPHPKCHYLDISKNIINSFKEILALVERNEYLPNASNIEWVKEHLSKSKVLGNFVCKLMSIAKK